MSDKYSHRKHGGKLHRAVEPPQPCDSLHRASSNLEEGSMTSQMVMAQSHKFHPELQARESDADFLKRRLLFPGIFQEESSSEDEDMNSSKNKPDSRKTGLQAKRQFASVAKEAEKVKRGQKIHYQSKAIGGHLQKSKRVDSGELSTTARNALKKLGILENVSLTREQLGILMEEMAKNTTNDYICLVHAAHFCSPQYDPYDLKIVKERDVGNRVHYTMSRKGVLLVSYATADFTGTSQFQREIQAFDEIKEIPFVAKFRLWKALKIWKSCVLKEKIERNKCSLVDLHFTSKKPLRELILEFSNIRENISKINLLLMPNVKSVGLTEFTEFQLEHLQLMETEFRIFEKKVLEMTIASCRATITEEGFRLDNYDEEMDYYLARMQIPVLDLDLGVELEEFKTDKSKYPGEWLSFSQQKRKRRVCKRLANFVRLIDILVQETYANILKNSLYTLVLEIHSRIVETPGFLQSGFEHQESFNELKQWLDTSIGIPMLSENKEPIFEVVNSWSEGDFKIVPSACKYVEEFQAILGNWRDVILSYENMSCNACFHPYTQPIINGYLEPNVFSEGPNLKMLLDLDEELEELGKMVQLIIQYGFHVCESSLKELNWVKILWAENNTHDLEQFREESDALALKNLVEKYTSQLEAVRKVEILKDLGLFRINNSSLEKSISPTITRCLNVVHQTISKTGGQMVRECNTRIEEAIKIINKYPRTAEEYVCYLEFLDRVQTDIDDIETDMESCSELFKLVRKYDIPCEEEAIEQIPQALVSIRDSIQKLKSNRSKIVGELMDQFNIELQNVAERMTVSREVSESKEVLDPKSDATQMLTGLKEVLQTLVNDEERCAKFVSYQKELQVAVTNFDELENLIFCVRKRQQLWELVLSWNSQKEIWMESPFLNLSPEFVENEAQAFLESLLELEESLPKNDVVPVFKNQMMQIQTQMGWIKNLLNPNIRQRHWDALNLHIGFDLNDKSLSLKGLSALGIENHLQFISKVVSEASSEFRLEAAITNLESSWTHVKFKVIPYKNHLFILGGTDEIRELLDDSLVQLAAVGCTSCGASARSKVDEWLKRLENLSKTLDEWMSLQRRWIQLEFIFSSPDISNVLPNETRMFGHVDNTWREATEKIRKNPSAFKFATQAGLLQNLKLSNELLDQIMKCLDDFLELKRAAFPRLYFLSNEELLKILAHTKYTGELDTQLRNLFTGIEKLELERDPSRNRAEEIAAMISKEKEKVVFSNSLKVTVNVEVLLSNVEDAMHKSLKKIMRICRNKWKSTKRTEWILKFPSQCILTMSQMAWAENVHRILDGEGNIPLKMRDLKQNYAEWLNELFAIVRGELPPLLRCLLSSLITVEVHAQDVISSLIQNEVNSSSSFDWVKQLRYYWDKEQEVVCAKIATAGFAYGYEYLGATSRLVVTPLTERAFLSLTGALQLNFGGAAFGTTGTGKTETIRDLGKALAVMCVVFNCLNGMDYKITSRFLSGVAQSGGWICFDHFDRIQQEMLSVIGQQMSSIKSAKEQKATRFIFEGKEIRLVRSCGVFITMNPGYAGRNELPDNLKSLFRPVSMMVPEDILISEVILYSEGFASHKVLAIKISQIFKLCSRLLSQKGHYDFGIRVVKSALLKAGCLKHVNPKLNEHALLAGILRELITPQLVADDVAVFEGIVLDLFPGVAASPEREDGLLWEECVFAAEEKGLQPDARFIRKILQLFETIEMKNGIILFGPTGGGKTTLYQVLASALSALYIKTNAKGENYKPVETYVLNPKAVSIGELYGEFNLGSSEWRDGLLGIMLRKAGRPYMTHQHWIVFDGPLEAEWAENLNSALDDNRILCLGNSERLRLPNYARMIFETDEISSASPATVSRCGIVFVDPTEMETQKSYFLSWLNTFFSQEEEAVKDYVSKMFSSYFSYGLNYIGNNCKEVVKQSTLGKVSTFCSLIESLSARGGFDMSEVEGGTMAMKAKICRIFVFAYVWSLGGNLHEKHLEAFDIFVRTLFEREENIEFPKSGMLFEYSINLDTEEFEHLDSFVQPFCTNPSPNLSADVFVPTVQTTQFKRIMKLVMKTGKTVLLTGPSGTGKTSIAKLALTGDKNIFPVVVNLSGQTTTKHLQKIVEENLEKRKMNSLKSTSGKKIAVFIDDLNMPIFRNQTAEPIQDLLRQMIEFKGYYEGDKLSWTQIDNVCFTAACSSPSGVENFLSARLLRHFCIIAIPNPSEASLRSIYCPQLLSFLADFDPQISEISECLVTGVISVYQMMEEVFRPVPSKPHYIFSMRDLSKCFQGIMQANKEVFVTRLQLVRLFSHECLRVFHDRLCTQEERSNFCESLANICTSILNTKSTVDDMKGIVFGVLRNSSFDRERNLYEEVTDKEKQTEILKEYMELYNRENSNSLNLVFFAEAVEHISRIVRILRMDRNNALLVGIGGVGKQSLTKLASFICRLRCFQIQLRKGYDLHAFRNDLKFLYETAGMKNDQVVFLLSDTQILQEEFLDDVHSILKCGEVLNLLKPSELTKMLSPLQAEVTNLGVHNKPDAYELFIRRVRLNLKIVFCMSPAGEKFRIRCRMFPALVSCCTVNWFNEWPDDALYTVAANIMTTIDVGGKSTADKMAEVSVFVYQNASLMAAKYFEETGRHYFITPSSFLEHMYIYSIMLQERRDYILEGKARIQNGLTKILETNEVVKQMRTDLKDLEPLLVQKSQAVKEIMSSLVEDQAAADIVRRNVQMDEATAKEKAFETQAIAEDAQKDLADALPALEAAVKSLDQLNKEDIDEIRQLLKPPDLVRTVMEAVCTLFGVKPDWNTSRQLLSDSNFLKKLYDFNKDGVPEKTLKNLKVYIENPKFTPKAVEKVSKACKSICLWVRAIDGYAKIFKTVEPKRKRYVTAQNELEQVMETLRRKTEQLNEVEKKIAVLRENFEGVMRERSDLEENMEVTAVRLKRAARLTKALASEQTRWAESVQIYDEQLRNIVGDIFIGSASIAYLGFFTGEYRAVLKNNWQSKCVDIGVPCTPGYTIASLADASVVRGWNANGLPRDEFFTENAVIATKGRRWPLIIDPQEQATQWIKLNEAENSLKVISADDESFMKNLEKCIRIGYSCLVENVTDNIPQEMEPVLLKHVFVHSGRTVMRVGDKNLDYSEGFRLFMTTKTANPAFPPEVCFRVTIINFSITLAGLEDQLLSKVVSLESPELESQSAALLSQINADKNQLVSLESKILRLLFLAEGNILDDEQLIQSLNNCKEASVEIGKRVSQAEVTEKNVGLAREKFRPVATRGCVLYFVVLKLSRMNPSYQFSLKCFLRVFTRCISLSEKTEDQEERLKTLMRETVLAAYINISRGLFEKDKMVFSFMLCVNVLKSKGLISDLEWNLFLNSESGKENLNSLKASKNWECLKDKWKFLRDLQPNVTVFKNISNAIYEEKLQIQIGDCEFNLCGTSSPQTNDHWDKVLTNFQKILLVKVLAGEKLISALTEFAKVELGPEFIESPLVDLQEIHNDLSKGRPLVFVLSTGSDPMATFDPFVSRMGFSDRTSYISLGDELGPFAESIIRSAMKTGDWVFLQNCHLSPCWLPRLETLVKQIIEFPDEVHDTFRLYLSSMPTSNFPISVLHASEKITVEPLKGLRANLRRNLVQMDKDFFEGHVLGSRWKKMVFGISFFHSVIQERKKFGKVGWNIKYDFTDIDRQCSLLNLELLCREGVVPWDALEFVIGEVTYGGKVTGYWDRRCLTAILNLYFSGDALSPTHTFSQSGLYYAPDFKQLKQHVYFVDKLPVLDEPDVFKMNENTNLEFQREERLHFFDGIVRFEGQKERANDPNDAEKIVLGLVKDMESKLPKELRLDEFSQYRLIPDSLGRYCPFTVFLKHEIIRFNSLLGVIRDTLGRLKNAIQGFEEISVEMEQMFNSFLMCHVPHIWRVRSYGSLRKLADWFKDFLQRFNFIRNFQKLPGPPSSFWLSGFFFQQGFLTAVLQSHARKYDVPIEQLHFLFSVTSIIKKETCSLEPIVEFETALPDDGVLVHGIYLEAAGWDIEQMTLVDSLPGEMCTLLPILHFLPSSHEQPTKNVYTAPLYNTSERGGQVPTTGLSSNFIEAVKLPSFVKNEEHWILQGTALLCQATV